jgi:hypothetical protein
MCVQVPAEELKDFEAARESLQNEFSFKELEDEVRDVFDKFIQ